MRNEPCQAIEASAEAPIERIDINRIDINDENEIRNWSKSLNATPEPLKEAVSKVGASADQVRQYLRSK
jgi:hypothetical protein